MSSLSGAMNLAKLEKARIFVFVSNDITFRLREDRHSFPAGVYSSSIDYIPNKPALLSNKPV